MLVTNYGEIVISHNHHIKRDYAWILLDCDSTLEEVSPDPESLASAELDGTHLVILIPSPSSLSSSKLM